MAEATEDEVPRCSSPERENDGEYQQVGGDGAFEADRPFGVRIVPNELSGRL